MYERMSKDRAEMLGLGGLAFLAGMPDQLDRFMQISGLELAVLRERAAEPGVLQAVLDFLLTDDTLVADFCKEQELEPRDIHLASRVLGMP